MIEKIINGIMDNSKEAFLEDVDPSIHEKMLIAYKHYLMETYASTIDPKDNPDQIIRIYSKMEIKKWKGQSLTQKLSRIIKDDNLEKLMEVSEIGYKLAQRKMGFLLSETEHNPDISEEEAQAYIGEMKQLAEQVRPFNIYIAQEALSEGILDFQFAANLTEDKSIRTARLK